MKKIKYISAMLLIWLGLVLIGEVYVQQVVFNLDNSHTYTAFDFGEDWSEAAPAIKSAAERHNVIAMAKDKKVTSELELNYVIYSTRELPKQVKRELGNGKNLKSLFLGSVYVEFADIEKVPALLDSPWIYLRGNEGDISAFIAQLGGDYSRTTTVYGAYTDNTNRNVLIGYWTVVLSFLLFLTLVDTFFQKKEVFIRVSLGASIASVLGKNIIADVAAYFVFFASGCFVIATLVPVWHSLLLVLAIFGIFVGVNSLIYLLLFKLDHKSATSNSKMPKRVLKFSYLIKSIAALFAVFAISSSIMLIQPTVKYFKANSFFTAHKNYDFGYFGYKINHVAGNFDELWEEAQRSFNMVDQLYKEYYDKAQPIILNNAYEPADNIGLEDVSEFGLIYANKNAHDYIASAVKGFSMKAVTDEVCILIPGKMSDLEKEKALEFAKYYFYDGYSYSVYYYNNSADVMAIGGGQIIANGFTFHKDPVIVFDTTHPADYSKTVSHLNGSIMYNFTDDILDEIIERFELQNGVVEITNALDVYNHFWFMIRAGVIAAVAVSALSMLLAIITISRIVSLEYTVNAVEFCVKKIHGYGAFRKNAEIIWGLFICSLVCSVVAVIAAMKLFDASFAVALISTAIIFSVDVVAVLWSVGKIEKAQIAKILKGGAL